MKVLLFGIVIIVIGEVISSETREPIPYRIELLPKQHMAVTKERFDCLYVEITSKSNSDFVPKITVRLTINNLHFPMEKKGYDQYCTLNPISHILKYNEGPLLTWMSLKLSLIRKCTTIKFNVTNLSPFGFVVCLDLKIEYIAYYVFECITVKNAGEWFNTTATATATATTTQPPKSNTTTKQPTTSKEYTSPIIHLQPTEDTELIPPIESISATPKEPTSPIELEPTTPKEYTSPIISISTEDTKLTPPKESIPATPKEPTFTEDHKSVTSFEPDSTELLKPTVASKLNCENDNIPLEAFIVQDLNDLQFTEIYFLISRYNKIILSSTIQLVVCTLNNYANYLYNEEEESTTWYQKCRIHIT